MPSNPQLWAVLIGVNTHPKKPLKGCLHDVDYMERYLRRYKSVKVSKYTAGHLFGQTDPLPTLSLPTYINITSKLKAIAKTAKPGDSVLIHYSGYGTQFKNPKNYHYRSDVALVLPDCEKGIRYFPGIHLAKLLKDLVERGLLVTLVLDCCFSGSVTRGSDPNDEEIRGVDWEDSIYENFPLSREYIDRTSKALSKNSRDASWHYEWLDTIRNPNCTLITACGPHEKARELYFEGKDYGKLSYYLIDSLEQLQKKHIADRSVESLLDYVRALLHQHSEKQSPMLRGKGDISFLNRINSGQTAYAYVTITQESPIRLNIGRVHGVCSNDTYIASPFDSADDESRNARSASIQLRVTNVQDLSCNTRIVTKSTGNSVQTGWKAKPLKYSRQPIQVNISWRGEKANELAEAIKHSRYPQILSSDGNKELPCYSVVKNENGWYEIHNDQGHRAHNVPRIQQKNSRAIPLVVLLLEHIAQFEHIKELRNPNRTPLFEMSFKIEVRDANYSLLNGSTAEMKHGENLQIKLKNGGNKPLYVWIYNMGSSWEISYSDCFVVEPKDPRKDQDGIFVKNATMMVPDDQKQCEDTIKILVTTAPTSIAPLRLPKIQERCEVRQIGQETRRGLRDIDYEKRDDRLYIDEAFIMQDRERDPGVNRQKTVQRKREDGSGEEWSIHTYCIMTLRRDESLTEENLTMNSPQFLSGKTITDVDSPRYAPVEQKTSPINIPLTSPRILRDVKTIAYPNDNEVQPLSIDNDNYLSNPILESSAVLPMSVEDNIPPTISVPSNNDGVLPRPSLPLYQKSLLAMGLVEPPVERGKTRVRWTCRCGRRLYDDYEELRPGALEEIRQMLRVNQKNHRQRNGDKANKNSTGSIFRRSFQEFVEFTAQLFSRKDGSSLPIIKPTTQSRCPLSSGSQQQPGETLFLLMCINHSRWVPKLWQENACSITSDQQLFRIFRAAHRSGHSSSRRQRLISLFNLKSLSSIRFVQFEAFKNYLVTIIKVPDFPPPKYSAEYRPCYAATNPPVGENLLMHYYHHPYDADDALIWFDRIPKKLNRRVQIDGNTRTELGWGIHFVEGLNWMKLWTLGLVGLLLSMLLGVLWSIFNQSIQSGFAISACLMILMTFTTEVIQAASVRAGS